MRLSFKQRLIGYFFVIFAIYTIGIIFFEQKENKKQKTEALQTQLDGYADLVHHYIDRRNLLPSSLTDISPIIAAMPEAVRVTIIDNDGKVLYDKDVKGYDSLENHLDRIEVKSALYQGYGMNIRESASVHKEYLYYAKYYDNYFVRVALPYNVKVKSLLKADSYFIYITIVLFVLVLILLVFAGNRFGKSIKDLKNLTRRVKNHEKLPQRIDFPNDELGDIGKELLSILKQKDTAQQTIELEREKLRQHFEYSEEGLAIFNSNFKKQYVNTHFIQNANLIANEPIINVEAIFEDSAFDEIAEFLNDDKNKKNNFQLELNKNGKVFDMKAIRFEDQSFELTIKDITKVEKNRRLKQEMTSNIAHELRTPVTVLRGFLETMVEQNLPVDKQKQFIDKAYAQSIRLSDLIEDISLLSKVEEQESSYTFEELDMSLVIDNVENSEREKMQANGSVFYSGVSENTKVRGNYNLLFSVFQNLIENTLKYAGENVNIYIDCYTQDDKYYYFTYYDTGKGVGSEHLGRIFERFYRIDEGRDRVQGGSGLGLSIVRNIILLHKGEIQAKRHQTGGLQFLFKLPKIK